MIGKTFCALTIAVAILGCFGCKKEEKAAVPAVQDSDVVYICTGPMAKRYHKTDQCRGLRRCSGMIKQVTVEEAEAKGRTPCHTCY